MTEDEWDDFEAKTTFIREQMPVCQCACLCAYRLHSSRSQQTFTCFSCRVGIHFGARAVGTQVEAAQ